MPKTPLQPRFIWPQIAIMPKMGNPASEELPDRVSMARGGVCMSGRKCACRGVGDTKAPCVLSLTVQKTKVSLPQPLLGHGEAMLSGQACSTPFCGGMCSPQTVLGESMLASVLYRKSSDSFWMSLDKDRAMADSASDWKIKHHKRNSKT